MKLTEHDKELLQSIIDDKPIENTEREVISSMYALHDISMGRGHMLRIKPETITIGDMRVPKPISEPLAMGQKYFQVNVNIHKMVSEVNWGNDRLDMLWLKSGLIHRTEEAAIQHAKAIIKISGGSYE